MEAWSETFFEGSLPEKRLRERAVVIGEAMTKRPGVAMTGAFDDAKEARNAYNFFENERVSMPIVLDPARRVLADKLRALPAGETVLAVQDTTEINLSAHPTMQGLGQLGNPKNRGLFLHPALAVSTCGVPLGVLLAQTWARTADERGKAKLRKERPFEEKESVRWWTTIERSEELVRRSGLLVHVGDAEADIYELFARARDNGRRFLVRAAQDRKVVSEGKFLWEHVEGFPLCDERRTIEVPERPATKDKPHRSARTATLAMRYGEVTLQPPKGSSDRGLVTVVAILARELDPPAGEEPIEWLLLTSDAISSAEQAWLRIDWYRHRWVAEEFNKVLKSGLRAEKQQYGSRETYETWLAFALITAVRLLEMNKRARIEPEVPAAVALSPDEERVLLEHAEMLRRRPAGPLRLRDAIVLIAKLGGYLGRAGDGPPGWLTLWRGYTRLCAMVDGYRLATAMGRARSS